MWKHLRQHGVGYLVAIVATAGAALLRWAFDGLLGDSYPFLVFMAAVAVAALCGGWRPGVAATLCSAATAEFLFCNPRGSFALTNTIDQVRSIFFVGAGLLVSWLYDALRVKNLTAAEDAELRRVKEDAEAWKARYEAAVKASGSIMYDSNHVTGEAIFGGDCEGILGYSAAEMNGPLSKFINLIHPDDRDYFCNELRRLDAGEPARFDLDYRMIHKDGRTVWMRDDGRMVTKEGEERSVRAVGFVKNVTEQRRAEFALRESEQRFRAFMNNTPMLAWAKDEQGRYVYLNRAFEERMGVRFQDIRGKTDFDVWPEEFAGQYRQNDQRALASDVPLEIIEETLNAKGERCQWWSFKFVYQNAEGKKFVGGTTYEVTEQNRAQEKLRQVAAQLAEADRHKDEFLATLAHELRNPLAPLRTGLEVMKSAVNDPVLLEQTRSMMERQTQQLVALVDDLLDVSRITRGKFELRKCRVNLDDVIRNSLEAVADSVREAGHDLTVRMVHTPIELHADPNRLSQIVSNLLNNAARYTPDGGRIWLTAERQGSDVLISVKDTGIGIPPDQQDRIFEMFAQLDCPLKGKYGLGIGLTLVKSLVEMHGGTIEVSSAGANQGTEFRVRLPILMESPVDLPEPVPPEPVEPVSPEWPPEPRGKLRVLVVDDNQAAADTLSSLLKIFGNEVRKAGDGQQAIEVAAEFLPDVVLMDIGMPRMNGFEAARHLRQQPDGDKITLIALTGWGQDDDKQRTADAGFDHHLVKPADPTELRRLLAAVKTSPVLPLSG